MQPAANRRGLHFSFAIKNEKSAISIEIADFFENMIDKSVLSDSQSAILYMREENSGFVDQSDEVG